MKSLNVVIMESAANGLSFDEMLRVAGIENPSNDMLKAISKHTADFAVGQDYRQEAESRLTQEDAAPTNFASLFC